MSAAAPPAVAVVAVAFFSFQPGPYLVSFFLSLFISCGILFWNLIPTEFSPPVNE
jgi:hypothetical protein